MPNTQSRPVTVNQEHLIKVLTEHQYSDLRTPLREYVANAHDACRDRADAKIQVWTDRRMRSIHISDNGCGMTEQVIIDAFTCLGGHYGKDGSVGQFGLGVLSAFVIADMLEVQTRSADEPHGWRLEWPRQAGKFTLEPIERAEVGTHATLVVNDENLSLVDDRTVRAYLKRQFGLFTTPILVGTDQTPVNKYHGWLRQQALDQKPHLLPMAEARDIMRQYCVSMDMIAVYGYFDPHGVRILLGLPAVEHSPLDLHKTWFFCKGILVRENVKKFFPENLSCLVGLFDHPGFKLQLDRENLIEDQNFLGLKNDLADHAMNFLILLGQERPAVMEQMLRLHRSMLLAHGQGEPRLRDLFREHYRFTTTNGTLRWAELVAFCSPPGDRSIYLLSESNFRLHVVAVAKERHVVVVEANDIEASLLEDIARAEGYQVVDAARLIDSEAKLSVPTPFRDLAARLAPSLVRHGIPRVLPMNLPQQSVPAIFETGTEVSAGASGQIARAFSVQGMLLNIAHPLVERLAQRATTLDLKLLQRAADLLFYIAVLDSPFHETRLRVAGEITASLVYALERELSMPASEPAASMQAKCFVSVPYKSPFDKVFGAVHQVLGSAPYYWKLVRSDDKVEGAELLTSIQRSIAASRRFIADVSGMNPNVLLELGMMLERDATSTVILADRTTFKDMPADLRGSMCLVYEEKLRNDPQAMRTWLELELRRNAGFCALQGRVEESNNEPRRAP